MAKKLEWRTVQRKVKDLLPFKHNPRSMNPKQIADLTRSLKKFNLVEIPVADQNNRLLAGHQRCALLQILGRSEEIIDVRVPSRPLTEAEYKQYLITSNKVTGSWNYELLAEYFDIDTLMESGFDETEISEVFADSLETAEDNFDVLAELKKIKKPKSKLGDIYQLGPHKLACCDSLNQENIKQLVGKSKIDMIYVDPIYNLSVNYDTGLGGKAHYGGTVNDSKPDTEYKEFLRKLIENSLSVAKPNCHVFYWSDQKYIGTIQELYRLLGVDNKRVCLWIKGSANPTPSVAFNKCYESCIYGVKGKPFISSSFQNLNEILNKDIGSGNDVLEQIMDIWLAKRVPGNQYQHSTQKPITLHEKPIKRCTKPNDTILDICAGAGSTLLAADAMKRICFAAEIEPIFIDLIIKRYERYSGIKAKKIYEK